MEPERKIEKLLRAYARKRRAGGDAFKLHPATRRMLQGEVARQSPKPDDEPESLSLWELFRERWAVLLGFALIIFFGATLFFPVLSSSKHRAENAEAMSKLKQLGAAAQIAAVDNRGKLPATLDELTNVLRSDQMLTDSVSGKRFVYLAGGAILNGLRSNTVLAYSPTDDKNRAVLFADGSVHGLQQEEFSALTNRTLLALSKAENGPAQKPNESPALPEVATAAPAAAAPVMPPAAEPTVATDEVNSRPATPQSAVSGAVAAGEFASAASSRRMSSEKSAPAQNAVKFKSETLADNLQLGFNNSQRYRQTATTKSPPVLDSFELQQNGNQISVVDRDGSIYNGSLQPVELASDSAKTKSAVAKPGAAYLLKKDLDANQNSQQSAQNYFFRVSGANRSLKQNVVFTGNLMPISNLTANAAQNNFGGGGGGGLGGQSKLADASAAQQSLFSNSRITGTVTIDHTNQIEINALPVP